MHESSDRGNRSLLLGLGLGAALMYFLDPDRGTRRRALVRDQLVHLRNRGQEALTGRAEDLRNRARGLAHEVRARRAEAGMPVDDEVLVARVRSEMGHHVRHAGAIEVDARDGVVTLRGHALASELSDLLGTVRKVRGVERVESQLEVHESAGDIPSLQGNG